MPAPKDKYTCEQIIQALKETRGMTTIAARRVGCSVNTIKRYIEKHPSVALAIKEERENTTDIAELSLFKAINGGEAWAVCFYLKTQGKTRGYIERLEHSGPEGQPIQIVEVIRSDGGN